ncbi:type II secretion system protein [Natranaerobius thermophilus]|uniref:Prepilin-type N-terminal cleavage/methylation domain-containing protein n=1 Tax=Natranaerobius thermophilus (strain ATCC BAA-1301 / DSM 18059 / JW/NM-WN-LF) TaxID=457570 RepID=B2A7F1_NATTJ|nr:type II secretion system protein [Natranaerobius thermophilus]ACB85660.1 hypothetical protein Nther_2093 [Natranaerobius thermophilus JW/NM-WN-LF]
MLNYQLESNNLRGFTLLEVLAGIVILGLIAIPLMSYFTQSLMTAGETRAKSEDITLASSLMEEAILTVEELEADSSIFDFADTFSQIVDYDNIEEKDNQIKLPQKNASIDLQDSQDQMVIITVQVNDYSLKTMRFMPWE